MIEPRVVFDLAVEFSTGCGSPARGRGEPTGPDPIELSYPIRDGAADLSGPDRADRALRRT